MQASTHDTANSYSTATVIALMGFRMDHIHAPTVGSGPTTQATSNGDEKQLSLQELIAQKENMEAELSALGSVLDSVSREYCTDDTLLTSSS